MSVVEQIEVQVVSDQEARRREILLRAAEIIEQEGWSQGPGSMSPDGPFCIMGAVGKAMGAPLVDSHWPHHLRGSHYSYLAVARTLGVKDEHAWGWNDMMDPGGERVARVLREMANGKTFYEASGHRP